MCVFRVARTRLVARGAAPFKPDRPHLLICSGNSVHGATVEEEKTPRDHQTEVVRHEVEHPRNSPRFVLTNLTGWSHKLYERVYCGRAVDVLDGQPSLPFGARLYATPISSLRGKGVSPRRTSLIALGSGSIAPTHFATGRTFTHSWTPWVHFGPWRVNNRLLEWATADRGERQGL